MKLGKRSVKHMGSSILKNLDEQEFYCFSGLKQELQRRKYHAEDLEGISKSRKEDFT
ncbi:unnamed protein product [Lupinus luteus]|uniref:Uncharacterized protein n=1 Tax=Lupinus luteus TaxID=3873 RepID=A0AAV1XC93_LUPLU